MIMMVADINIIFWRSGHKSRRFELLIFLSESPEGKYFPLSSKDGHVVFFLIGKDVAAFSIDTNSV